jgi:hypothetical protein
LPAPSKVTEDIGHDIEIGDTALVLSGPSTGYFRTVEAVCLPVVSLCPLNPSLSTIMINICEAVFHPPTNALCYSAECGYNVSSGDTVVIVQGRWLGKRGIVEAVDLDKKTLEVNAWADGVSI